MGGGLVVGSYLELYTQFLGWAVYNNIWFLIKESGLIWIPFLAILWDGWLSSLEKSSFESVAAVSFRKIVMGNVVAMFVMIFAAEPVLPLNPSIVKLNKPELQVFGLGNVLGSGEVTVGDTGTTYDNAFSESVDLVEAQIPDLGIPVLWAHVMNWGSGFSYALIAGLPKKEDLRFLQNYMQSVFIDDPMLSNEVSRFTAECYAPARAKFFRIKDQIPARLNTEMVNDILLRYPNDLNWMGSMVLSKSQGLYAKSENMGVVSDGYRARNPVERFIDDDESRGRPYCDEWWEELRGSILSIAQSESFLGNGGVSNFDVLNEIILNSFDVAASEYVSLNEVTENYIVETYLKNTRQRLDIVHDDLAYLNTSYTPYGDPVSSGLAYGVKGFLSFLGSAKEGAVWSVKFYTILLALPMIQAIVIFSFIISLPFLLIFTKLGVKGVVYGFLGFFSLKLLTGLWGVASWLDTTLIAVMYPDESAVGAFLSGANNDGTERILLDMMTTGMHIVLPMTFLYIVTVAGFQVGNVISGSVQSSTDASAKAGSTGGEMGTNAAQQQISNFRRG
ncbi:conjugal transfer protein TraG N-terminal domain-containing protein [Paraneptunicella aestuarii]|uniref:conjugal transfer protein TraG N-terminal domain-containing protein n=1 Tax=Paraneptunicella aestuarii TaxID=2831148 RepID=UPI001E3DCA7C|nr:conjugal transfer protein TraG N-terminal domain-containing protein [Paraneptunicella aestuarii]UAA39127.1 conjugal transfer protein TraG N-terminal domain-containing protein [Paraneptunicella aestuarii]